MGNAQCTEKAGNATPSGSGAKTWATYTPEYVAALEKRLNDLELAHANRTHAAFLFIKPHAVTDAVKKLVAERLAANQIHILSEGAIAAKKIDEEKLIDTHYGAIAARAVKQKPSELVVQPKAQEAFQKTFGLPWADALKDGKVYNAKDAAEHLKLSTEELGSKWDSMDKEKDLVKFGGGFYCGKIGDIFVINGFYLLMRNKFTAEGTSIYYYSVEWDARSLSWGDFRGKVLGATDPAKAAPNSMRNSILANWQALGLTSSPNTGDNGVHASASPFEALAERANWLKVAIEEDFFGRAMIAKGIPLATIEAWAEDPSVTFEDKKQSLFDLLEDRNSFDCLQRCAEIKKLNP